MFPIEKLLNWYDKDKRDLPWRKTTDIYKVWVSEVMLQQTQVKTVIPYYKKFLESFSTVSHLAAASEQELLKLWEGLGYYSRVRNLHKAAKLVMSDLNGIIPVDEKGFSKLPGVGPYICAAVLSISQDRPIAAVDGNVLRVYTRFKGISDDIRKNTVRNRVTAELQPLMPEQKTSEFTQAFMELGALVCTPKTPACSKCPFQERCFAFNNDAVAKFPYKSPLGKVPHYDVSVGIIVEDGKIFIQKRPSKGHLGGMWEFPGGKGEKGETMEQTLIRECREELGWDVGIIEKLALVKHAYSHFKIHLHVFICRLTGEEKEEEKLPLNQEFTWIGIHQLEEYPFPGANHKFFPQLRSYLQ